MSVQQEQQGGSLVDAAMAVYEVIDTAIKAGQVIGKFWAMMTHGVTNIKAWENRTGQELEVFKVDGGGVQDHYRIPAGQTVHGDMWIPWADNAGQYGAKHATLQLGGQLLAVVWQSGDKVRFNIVDAFVDGGFAVPGAYGAGGDRKVIVIRDSQGRVGFVLDVY